MGGGIAIVFANAGVPVFIKDVDQAALDRGLANIKNHYAASVKRGRFTQQFVGNRMFSLYRREAQFLVEEGAEVEAVDKALRDFGMAIRLA